MEADLAIRGHKEVFSQTVKYIRNLLTADTTINVSFSPLECSVRPSRHMKTHIQSVISPPTIHTQVQETSGKNRVRERGV